MKIITKTVSNLEIDGIQIESEQISKHLGVYVDFEHRFNSQINVLEKLEDNPELYLNCHNVCSEINRYFSMKQIFSRLLNMVYLFMVAAAN